MKIFKWRLISEEEYQQKARDRIIAGWNLYRVAYMCAGVAARFQCLVLARDGDSAARAVPGAVTTELIERDISMRIPSEALGLGKEGEK